LGLGSARDPSDACPDATTQAELDTCIFKGRSKALDDLDHRYDELKKRLPAGLVGRFDKAKDAWREYRILECEANGSVYEGGSIQSAQTYGCEWWLTKQRIEEVDRMLDELDH